MKTVEAAGLTLMSGEKANVLSKTNRLCLESFVIVTLYSLLKRKGQCTRISKDSWEVYVGV